SGQGSLLRSPNGVNVGYGLKLKVLLDDEEVVCDHPVIYTVRDDREAVRDYFLAYHNCLLDNKVGIRLALDAEEKGYYFELLAEDETTVYLRTKDTYADELAACAAGLALITAAQSQHGYLEVQTNGKYTFHVIDADGEAIGIHPNQFDTEAARDAQLEEVKSFFALRQLDYQIVQEPNYFNWNIQAGADGPVLCTTLNFQSEAAAQQNWEYLPADLGRVDHYRVVEEDSQWWVELIREDGLALARSGPYSELDAAHSALATMADYWREHAVYKLEINCYSGAWYFVLRIAEEEVLIGTKRYPSQLEATCAFLKFTELAALPENYQDIEAADACSTSFVVLVEEEVLAEHPYYHLPEAFAERKQAVIDEVVAKRLFCRTSFQPFSWLYRIVWEDCSNRCTDLLVQAGGGVPTAMEAKQAAKEVLTLIATAGAFVEVNAEESYSFAVLNADGQ
ncbi:MAG: hypothetical protein AAFQ37_13850, partial [Bacteroidota bacterium]